MLGNVFSPYFARARRLGRGDALDHSALNVALYRQGRKRWTMTERGRDALQRSSHELRIGPSRLEWDGSVLRAAISETCVPVPRRLRGEIRVTPLALAATDIPLDRMSRHVWRPLAPRARIDVEFTRPAMRWSGAAYVDSNRGDEPLESAFRGWDWSRTCSATEAMLAYEVELRDGERRTFALKCGDGGSLDAVAAPPRQQLPRTKWRVERATRFDTGTPVLVERTLEDTPFYARSLVRTSVDGRDVTAFHESLSLDRFQRPWVQAMLPFRMPRRP